MEHLIQKKSRNNHIIEKDLIYFKINNPKTLASYIMLKEYYKMQDESNKRNYGFRLKMINLSRTYLTNVLNKFGNLHCTYCPKKDLVIELNGMRVPNDIKATIDHIEPISKGGDLMEYRNLTVSCSECNNKKSNIGLLTYLGY